MFVEVGGEVFTSSSLEEVTVYEWEPFVIGCAANSAANRSVHISSKFDDSEPQILGATLLHEAPASDPDPGSKTLRVIDQGRSNLQNVLADDIVNRDAGLVCLLKNARVWANSSTITLSMPIGVPIWAERLAAGYWSCRLDQAKQILHFNILCMY